MNFKTMTISTTWILPLTLALTLGTLTSSTKAAEMLEQGGYAERPLSLPRGTLRIDIAPSDFGYMDFGEVNDGRAALVIGGNPGGPTTLYSGVGAALGVVKDFEVGALLFPFPIHPDFDFGNMEAYARYQITHGVFQLGGHIAVQIPTAGRFGVGLGLPMRILAGDDVRFDTGLEFEIMADPGQVHLDIPLAVAFDINDVLFIGPRTGARFPAMQDFQMPLGVFFGGTIADVVDLSTSFTFWNFINTYTDRTVDLRYWQIMLGATVFVDVF
jgi:hypothetical protein